MWHPRGGGWTNIRAYGELEFGLRVWKGEFSPKPGYTNEETDSVVGAESYRKCCLFQHCLLSIEP